MSDNNTKPQPPENLARPDMAEKPTVILGGGPAGLTAGYLLSKKGLPVIVLEAEDQVGGIAKTAVRDGYRFDLGGHRFFTKVKEVDDLWHEIMREEFLERPRMSRIYWRDRKGRAKFLDYPLRGPDVMKKLGPVDLTKANYRTLLLGMKGSTNYVYRILVTSSAGTCTSQDYTFMTGAVPSSVPKPTVTISNASAHAKGFIVTSSGLSGTGAYIYDSDGAPVWWATGPTGVSRIQMSWDGSKMYMTSLNVQNSGGQVKIVDMDGNNATTISGLTTAHHDMAAIPGGFATLTWTTTGMDVPCALIERADDGTMKTIIANVNTVYNSNTFHTNSIHYYPSDNTYTLGDRNPNLYVKVSRTGTLLWQLGGSNPKDMSKFFSGTGTWSVNHGHHLTADGTFYLFNNGTSGASTVRGFKLNTSSMTATSSFTYSGSTITSMVLGDVQSLPNGNILVTGSTSGQLTEVTTGSQVVATFKFSSLGYSEYRDSLYGPPPR